jgi:4-amino-4-deoxy-L-arabinose transferase-like glycosyltransferase
MPSDAPTNTLPRGLWSTLWPWLIVALGLVLAGAIRLRLLNMPLERDEGEYAYLGQLLLQGVPPYELVYTMKLPGTGLVYTLGMAVFGQTAAGVHLILLLANSLTTIFVFLLGRRLGGDLAGTLAAVAHSVMSVCPAVVGLAAHATHFVVLFAVPAVLLLLKADHGKRPGILFTSGILFGLAFLMKQPGLCFGLFAVAYLIFHAWQRGTLFTLPFARPLLIFAFGLMLPLVLTALALAAAGDFGRFWFWTFTYARHYETTLTLHQGLHEHLLAHLSQTKDLSFGFWLLALGGLPAAACLKRLRPALFFSVSLWLFAFVGTAAGLYFRGHYFILLLPAFAILLGLAVTAWRDLMPAKFLPDVLRSLPVIVFALILGWNLYYYEAVYFEWPADQVAQQLYRENPFSEAVAAAELIRDHSFPDARIAVIGSEPEIYFYAHRHSATGYIYTYPLMESQPYASVMQQDMVREIESAHPEFLVQVPYPLSWLPQPGSSPYLIDWSTNYAAQFYHPIATVGFAPGRGLVATWNPGTTNLPPLTGEYLTIYQRLPGTEP